MTECIFWDPSSPARSLSGKETRPARSREKLDHFAGSFSSGPSKSISVDSIIAIRSSERIPNISLKMRSARVKDKINKWWATSPVEKGNFFLFSSGYVALPLDVSQGGEWHIRPSTSQGAFHDPQTGWDHYGPESAQSTWWFDITFVHAVRLNCV